MINNSQPCSKSELDLFYTLPTNTSIISSNITTFPVASPLDGSEDSFSIIIPENSEYTDLNDIFLELEITIPGISDLKVAVPKNDLKPEEGMEMVDKVCAPINNFGHSLFRSIELSIGTSLNKKLIESNNSYAYKAYLLNLLNFPEEVKSSYLGLGMWEKDEAGKFNDKTNTAFAGRLARFGKKNTHKLLFPLHLDLFNSNRFLMSKCGLTITFKKNDDKFLLMGDHFNKYQVKIMRANILARRCSINPSIVTAHQNAMQLAPIKYPIKQNRIFTAHIEAGRQDFTPPAFLTTIPNKIVIGLVRDSAYQGDALNPYNFEHFNLQKITLTLDSQEQSLKLDADNNDCVQPYHAIFQSLNLYNQGSIDLTQKDFLGGNCLYCFNLNPDKGCSEQFNNIRSGSMVFHLLFDKPLDFKTRMICLLEFDNQLNINHKGEVSYDHVLS